MDLDEKLGAMRVLVKGTVESWWRYALYLVQL